MPIAVSLTETAHPPTYQAIAAEALRLSRLGFSSMKIGAVLTVSDKTVSKALCWIARELPAPH